MIKVYLAEDYKIMRESMIALLDKYDEVDVVGSCENGQEVIDACDEMLIDVILMDIKMPFVDGLEASHIIKERHPYIKIIILSMHNEYEYVKKVMESRIEGYLLKNTDSQELLKAIRMVMDGANYYTPETKSVYDQGIVSRNQKTEPKDAVVDLTDRETEIVCLISSGNSSEEISDLLNLSKHTVSAHRRNIHRKTDCSSPVEITRFAIKHGIVSLDE